MQTTNNLGLKKPGAEDVVNIEDLNSNSDALDGKFGASSGHGHTGAAGDGPKIGSNGLAAGAATDTVIGSRTVSDTTAPTGDSGTPTTLFGWLAYMIKAITGGATWRTLPGMTIAAIKTILDAATNAGTASTLMKRDSSGRAQVAAPSAAADIARKDTVDVVQSNLSTHVAVGSAAHGATSTPTVSTLMARDSTGRAQVVAPSVAADIANKGYVDSGVSTAQGTANAAQTRANAALPRDGSEPFTGAYFRISNTAPIIQMNETDTGKNWYVVADGNYLSIREDNLSTERVVILPGGKMTINTNTVWHAGNDGLGSGLDADMVRGKIPLLKDGSEKMNGIMEFSTGAADTSGSTGIKGNINGWTRLDPNGHRFLVPVGNGAVNDVLSNWLTVENAENNWAQMLAMKSNGDIYIRGSRVLHQQDYNMLFQYANDGKTAVANAVTAKGVSASPSDTFATLAAKVGQIVTGVPPVNLSAFMSTTGGHLGPNHVVHAAFTMNVIASVVASARAYNPNYSGYSYVYVRKNGLLIGSSWYSSYNTQAFNGTVGRVTIDVVPGDTIDFVTYCSSDTGYAGIDRCTITNAIAANTGGSRTVGEG